MVGTTEPAPCCTPGSDALHDTAPPGAMRCPALLSHATTTPKHRLLPQREPDPAKRKHEQGPGSDETARGTGRDGHVRGTPQHRDVVLFCRRDGANPAGFIKELRASSRAPGTPRRREPRSLTCSASWGKKRPRDDVITVSKCRCGQSPGHHGNPPAGSGAGPGAEPGRFKLAIRYGL